MKKTNNKTKNIVNPNPKTQSKKQIEQTVRNLVEAEIINLGYEVWDIEYYNDKIEWLLEITIENPLGISISINDCEKVTRAANPIIDAADPIENSYSLAVSSPGLNRELKNDYHLSKYIDKEVTVKLFTKNEAIGDKTFNAILKEFSKENFKFTIVGRGDPDAPQTPVVGEADATPFQKGAYPAINLTKKEIAHIYAYDEIDI